MAMYVDDSGGGSSQPPPGWGSIGDSMARFASMAADGGIEVNDTGGQALLNAIHKMQDWVSSQETKLYQLAQEMPLGSSHAAQVMKPYVQQVATDGQGFLTTLNQFRESLKNAEQGIKTAMANYRATEEANQAAIHKAGPA
jgi:hypothetical protein